MQPNRLASLIAATAAGLLGLALFFVCLKTVSAAATTRPAASVNDAVSSQIWHVVAPPAEGLVGYWKFDQVFDSMTYNSAFLTNQTILTGGSSITTSVPPTVALANFADFGALALDGVSGAAVVSDSFRLNVPTNSFSVAAWVRRVLTGTSTGDLIYDSGTQTNHWFFGFLGNSSGINKDKLTLTTNGLLDYSSPFTVTDSNWHHVAAVVSGSVTNNLTIYLDGVAAPVISAMIANTPSGPKLIGNKNGSLNTPFDGDIDELRLYDFPLSAAQVGRLAAGRGCTTDGLSWPTAFGDLQCAMAVAASGDQIWLGPGTHRPGTARAASFHVVKNLSLLGGFNGTESSPAQRPPFNPNAPLTVLSGDAAGDDVSGTFANFDDNTCNVGTITSNIGPGSQISLTIDGLAIADGNASEFCTSFPLLSGGAGLLALESGQLALNNVVFQFNRASDLVGSGLGGGLLNEGGQLTLSNVHFVSNTADIGGGLGIGGGNITITASSFVSNTANQGGAIDLRPGVGHTTLAVTGGSFTANQAQDGGAVEDQVLNGLLDLSFGQVTFTNNRASGGDGGAVSNAALAPGVVQSLFSQATFNGNSASVDGGAIADFGGSLTITGSVFSGNSSSASAGGALEAASVVTLTNNTFVSNTARSAGGAVSVIGTLVMSGGSVTQNQAEDSGPATDLAPVGGGVFVSGTAVITGIQFYSNTAFLQGAFGDLAGGGGLAVTGTLTLTGGDFQGNRARQGGGLQAIGSATIQGSLFQGNNASEGGGVFADGHLVLATNRLIDNTVLLVDVSNQPGLGGGVFLQNGDSNGQISNNLFLGNEALSVSFNAPSGAAMSLGCINTLVSNNTIVSSSLITTSAVSLVTGTASLFNNIITSHTVALENQGGFPLFDDYNLFHGDAITSTGVIVSFGHSRAADPRFVAPALDDYRLRLDSPAVDAGENSQVPPIVTTDLSGGKRFVDVPSVPDTGAGSAPIVDIGAFEVNNELYLPLIRK